MRKMFYVWVLAMVVLLCGCQGDVQKSSDAMCQLIPGTLEANQLEAVPGNYERSRELLAGSFVEIETGYYCIINGYLHYADKTDLDNWVVVCPYPDCEHYENPNCVAVANTDSGMVIEDNRLYFMSSIEHNRHLYTGGKNDSGTMLCSMANNGTDLRMEHICEEALLVKGGDIQGYYTFPGGYIAGIANIGTDGTYTAELWNVDGEQEHLLMEKKYSGDISPMVDVHSARQVFGLRGDRAFCTGMIDGNSFRWLCWIQNGEMQQADINNIPYPLKYLSGNIIRTFLPNDGYYDYDLLTGEATKLADSQLENSGAFILAPNCIFESTLIHSGSLSVEEQANQMELHSLRFFDGQNWNEVDLPIEILEVAASKNLGVCGLFSDCVIFSITTDGRKALYKMDLSAKEYKLEYCGELKMG